MKRLVLTVILFLGVAGCDVASDMKEMSDKQSEVTKLIKETYGWESQVGWNILNGTLTQVTVALDASEVGSETVSSLESAIKKVVAKAFGERPKSIVINIVVRQGKET